MNSKKSILFLISSLANQGPVQALLEIVSYLNYEKYNVTIFVLSPTKQNSLQEQFTKLNINIIQNEDCHRLNFFKLFRFLKSYINNFNIQIIHSHCFRSLCLAYLFKNKVTCIHSIYIYPGLQAKTMNGYFVGNLLNFTTKFLLKKIHFPIACAKNVSDEFLVKDKMIIKYIRNGTTWKNYENKNNIKQQLGLDLNSKYFISIGRLSPEKNFKTLINAFIKAEIKDCKLIIIGDGNQLNLLNEMVKENILLTGFKKNISDYLIASDFYITTSLTEGMALSTIFAMASGLPLLLSDINPHKEVFNLADKKEIGILFNNNDQSEIIDAIRKMSNSKIYPELSKNVINIYNQYFSGENMSKSYQDLYDEI